ncbi:recombinase family protein [Pseudarthrobacter sp. NPDC058119]|uniref:recombinase family protein n=1 Tax=Pseudarthrobacter sp. NPDC058119 TaxID=3346348 RepID=UPI0036DD27D3
MGTAIYVRQSKDSTGNAEAVDRQENACRLLAQAKGWDAPRLFSDNDISATSGKTRPAFEALLRDIENGSVQSVAVWHLDRLTRSIKDLQRVIDAGKTHRVNIACVQGVSLDLGDHTGIAVATIITAIAAMEAGHKGARQIEANKSRATKGKAFWTRRPFGYDRKDGKVFVVKAEAKAIRSGAKAVLAGATLQSVANEWNAAGLVTTYYKKAAEGQEAESGKPWNVTSVRRLLLNPRYAGRRIYNGDDIGDGEWPAILDAATSKDLEEYLTNKDRRTAPADLSAKYLLSGIAVCGKCGKPMFASPMGNRMVYRCFKGYCLSRRLELVDEVVIGALLLRLSQPEVVSKLTSADDDIRQMQRTLSEKRSRRDELAALLADGLLSPAAVREQSGRLTKEIDALEAEVARASMHDPVAALAAAEDVAQMWGETPLEDRRKIVRSFMDISILPAGKGVGFSEKQVQIAWKK